MKFFNTAGPVRIDDHYMLPPLQRWDMDDIEMLIAQKKYFLLHAPRQTGKSSCLLALMEHLNQQGQFYCVYMNVEPGQAGRENIKQVIHSILIELQIRTFHTHNDSFVADNIQRIMEQNAPEQALNLMLTEWSQHSSKPIVLLIDEIDSLVGNSLISVLRQIRGGYDRRPTHFPQSIVLCGVRDLKDYRLNSQEGEPITGGSAFNIKAESLRLTNFSKEELATIYEQHTKETGQKFEPEVVDYAFGLTQGQPWLCNALAYEVCFKIKENRDRKRTITKHMIRVAKENLILRRETHLDQLVFQLEDPRVKQVIGALLSGVESVESIPEGHVKYTEDLGLIVSKPQLAIANPIYQEVIPRALTWSTQVSINQQPANYVDSDGRLNVAKLLQAFQQFFRENSEHWVERFEYKEAGPQLLIQAFLQRVVNGGGYIHREYGLGRKRTDLLIEWQLPDGTEQRVVLELKILHRSLEKVLTQALPQTHGYMDRVGTLEGHLLCFDRSLDKSWDDKIFHEVRNVQGVSIEIWGM